MVRISPNIQVGYLSQEHLREGGIADLCDKVHSSGSGAAQDLEMEFAKGQIEKEHTRSLGTKPAGSSSPR